MLLPLIQRETTFLYAALMFYTRIPVPQQAEYSDDTFHQSRKYFPLIGLLVGAVAVMVLILSQTVLPLSVSLALSMISTILLTGAFHEDGFADACDGFGGGWDKKQILAIMKDSRVGSYATIGIVCLLGLKFLVLYELGLIAIEHSSMSLLVLALLNGHALSRLGTSLLIEKLDYVQDIELSKIKPATGKTLSRKALCYSALFILPTTLFLLALFPPALFSIGLLLPAFYGLCTYFKQRIGGYTGDCLGATQQILEVVFYLGLLTFL